MPTRSLVRLSLHAVPWLLLAAGCASTTPASLEPDLVATRQTVKNTSTTTITAAPIIVQQAPAAPPPEPEPAPKGDSITASASLRQLCGISADEGSAHFDTASAKLKSVDNDLLSKVAACIKDGKLGERKLQILGFTDPRGSEEYNLKLGRDRADAAKGRLVTLGVERDKVMTESRGESEAKGTDETTWAFDRRVEMHLDNENEGVNSGPGSAPR